MSVPKFRMLSPALNIVTLGLASFSALLQAISFSSHGWAIWTQFDKETTGEIISIENYIGLWYSVVCKTGKCETMSHLDVFVSEVSAGNNHREVQYSLRIWSQVIATFALIAAATAALLSVPFLCKSKGKHHKRLTLGVSLFSCISCCLEIAVVANWGAEQIATRKVHSTEMIFEFPWSLLIGGLGGALSGFLGIMYFVVLCLTLDNPVTGGLDQNRPSTVYIPLMTQNSTVSQFSADSNTTVTSVVNENPRNDNKIFLNNAVDRMASNPPDVVDSRSK